MAGEPNAAKIVDLALVPIGSLPQTCQRRHLRQLAGLVVFPAGQEHFDHEPMALREAGEVVNDFQMGVKTGLGSFLGVRLEIIHTANAVKQLEPQARVVAQEVTYLEQVS